MAIQQGFRTLDGNPYVYQEVDSGASIAYGIDTSTNLIKIQTQATAGATPTGTANISIDPGVAGGVTIAPHTVGRVSITNLTVSSGSVILSPLAGARPSTIRASATGQLSTLLDSVTDGQVLISSSIGTPIWASLTAGAGITITPGHNSISIEAAFGTTEHAVQVGDATGGIKSIAVGATGEILAGSTGADPAFTSTPTVTTMYATTFDTNVAAAGVTLAGTTLAADGTDVDISINITPKGAGTVNITELSLTTDLSVANGGTGASTLTDHGVLLGSGTGAITATAVGATGEIFVGSTGADAAWLAAGDAGKVLTAHGAGSAVTWETPSGGGGMTITEVTADVSPMVVDNGYITNKAGTACSLALPTTCAVGKVLKVVGKGATGWVVTQAAGQQIMFGDASSTLGATGSVASSLQYDCITMTCVTADTIFVIDSAVGNITIV